MTKDQNLSGAKPVKKYNFRRFSLLVLAIIGLVIFAYLQLTENYRKSLITDNKNRILKSLSKAVENNIETTIEDKDFSQNLKIEELEEKYKQLEIKINSLRIADYLSKVILSFYELQSLIENEQNYDLKLQELGILSFKDSILSAKVEDLGRALKQKNFTANDIENELNLGINNVISLKVQNDKNTDFLNKVKNALSQLILVRRIDGKVKNDGDKIDLALVEITNFIKGKHYQKALDKITTLDKKYQQELNELYRMLEIEARIESTSGEIFVYLKKVASNV